MTTTELLGKAAAKYLKDHLIVDDSGGTARFLLDCLTAQQTAAVARAVLADAFLAPLMEIKLPLTFLKGEGLPEEILTAERTTYFRNAECPKSAWLLANVGDDEQQGLTELVPIGAPELLDHPEIWVGIASNGLSLMEAHLKWWRQALKGLVDARQISLERFSEYIAETRFAIGEQGHPIRPALGYALPALHLPRDTCYFNALNDRTSAHASRWKNLYATAFRKRSCFLRKQTPTQALLDEEQLQNAFEKVRDHVPTECHPYVERFIKAPSGWNDEAARLAQYEWENIKPIFDGLKREKFNLGRSTIDFYDERDPEELTDKDRDYLERLIARKTTEAEEEDEDFFRDHRLQLKDKPSLKTRWDRFIFGSPIESEDFISGLSQCLQALFDQDQQSTERELVISSDKRNIGDLKAINRDAGLFFSFRYRRIKELFGRSVAWDVGKLFEFSELDETWRAARKPYLNRSVAKTALQIKFFFELEITLSNGAKQTYTKQLIWKFNPNSMSSQFHKDWERLEKHPLVRCQANRELVSGKGRFQSIDLRNIKTLLPTFAKDRGSLVSVYQKDNDLQIVWPRNLQTALEEKRIDTEPASVISGLFEAFSKTYAQAIKDFRNLGPAAPNLLEQLTAYSKLLIAICRFAKGDRNREGLLRPLLEIGAVPVEGGPVASISVPWHPLRMAAMANKALQVAGLLKHLLTTKEIFFGDTKLYFEELEAELAHPYYPEIILGWKESKPELLSLSDHHLDYSLHEPSTIQPGLYADTNEDPAGAALRIIDVLKRYLALHPHEQANCSIVLYNCDSARLPQTIVDKIQDIHDEKEDMRCQVILRHRDGGKLRDLYEQIIGSSDLDADSFVASEATRDFMARLRIGIMADEAPPPEAADGPPMDVVFLQDVIARHAKLEWYSENAQPVNWEEWVPPRWSRRRPAATDDMKSVVYLCCPVASSEGWNYLTALTTFFKGDWDGVEDTRLVPARQLDFNDGVTQRIFKEVHNLGNWVVNYDELLDRRQLVNQNVKVIRYKQSDTQGRNMLISSNASTTLLHRMVLQRLRDLTLGLKDEDLPILAKRFIDDANLISGDLVLRAAKRGRNASELMGVVLSRYLIQRELGQDRYFGWYFLDDYSDWLGQKEEHIADILSLSPAEDEAGNKRLAVVISESKYIDYGSLSTKRKESQKQLRQTIDRIGKALFGDPGRLDRDIWLSRFSDMVLNGIQFPAYAALELSQLRRSIREGDCAIYLRGYSHVFVSGPTDCPECSDFAQIAACEDSYQEVFSRAKLRELVLHFWNVSDPIQTRKTNADKDIWFEINYKQPSDRIRTLVKVDNKSRKKNNGEDSITAALVSPNKLTSPGNSGVTLSSTSESEMKNQQLTFLVTEIPPILVVGNTDAASAADTEEEKTWQKQVESKTKGALQQFQLQSKLISSLLTPNAALLKFQGSANLTVEQVLKRRSEFLTTHGLNLISIRAEPGLVALSIERPKRRILTIGEAWSQWKPDTVNGNQELLIGIKEDDGSLLLYSPKKYAPHTLIAGSTGSGKSVLMQNVILSIAGTNTPEQAKILLIDPKHGVDYFAFESLPHLQQGIITEQKVAVLALTELVSEMDRRYLLLRENRVSNIHDLLKKANATEKPPVLWVIHDEFAEWMLTKDYKEAVEDIVGRLGVKARAAGIFLIFAAQRPDSTVMPMQLRSNLGNRLVLRVDGGGTSEIALGVKGAERLLGKGHLCAKLEGEPDLIYAQVPFIPETIIEALSRGAIPPLLDQ